jgi:HSP20 family protein
MAMTFDPFTELDRLAGSLLATRQGPRQMPVDLYRDGDRYVLCADMPGVDPGSVDVDVDGQVLTVKAQRTADARTGAQWLAKERPHGSYLRQFSLGEGVDASGISAHYDAGVLSIVIPVTQKAAPRRIEVTTSPATAVETGSGTAPAGADSAPADGPRVDSATAPADA